MPEPSTIDAALQVLESLPGAGSSYRLVYGKNPADVLRDALRDRAALLGELEKLVTYAVVEGEWECPAGCEDPSPHPDSGEMCEECSERGVDSVRVPTAAGHPGLLAYLEAGPWKR